MGIPLLIWPEDRLILRQTDLPVLYRHVNKPVDWIVMSELRTFRVRGDDDLRNEIQANFAYAVTDSDNVIDYVTEFEVRSR